MEGNTAIKWDVTKGNHTFQPPLLSSGIYFLHCSNGQVIKLVKQ
jgi:hypothetical protein